ncbi:FHA domain-containing protein [Paludisphaera soli]|uniref:FHA domain-containing protein n=1 Tax=Paludisphaera soli TaxID=2712865 RepID=UPI001F10C1F5|nr:FHA domain-containing protein [Paludisphaera soli]
MSAASTAKAHVMAEAARTGRIGASARQAYDLALAGALGGLFGLYLYVETVEAKSVYVRDAWAGAILGGAIGFFLNAWGPLRDGSWRRMARAAARATPASAVGGAVGLVLGEFVIGAFQGGLLGRAASWTVLGLGIGLGQGIADRSFQRLTFGLIGGGLGGFIGGLCFEALRIALGNRYDLSQALGVVILGGGLGLFLALVEQALRRAWVQVASGRQEGRIYLLARPTCRLGLDEKADVGIFGDPAVERAHAEIVRSGDGYVLRNLSRSGATRVNGAPCAGDRRLGDGDRIELGKTSLIFRRR